MAWVREEDGRERERERECATQVDFSGPVFPTRHDAVQRRSRFNEPLHLSPILEIRRL